jgi:Glycosyltransferase family 87
VTVPPSAVEPPVRSRPYLYPAVLAASFLLFAVQAWLFQRQLAAPRPVLTDFNDYHVVGRMVLAGRTALAYDWSALRAEQIAQTGAWAFMPWAYPPPFTLLTGVLGLLPIWAAYLLFVGGTWLLFVTALRRLAGPAWLPALVVALPAVLINAKCGQNGFLSAGLIGWFLVGLRRRSASAGWPLGLMIFKPHLGVGIGLLALLERQWSAIPRAAVLAIALCLVSTLVLGPAIWSAFREGTAIASAGLWSGAFPLERMTSVFAALHRFGVAPAVAMAGHLAVALAALAALVLASVRRLDRDRLLALSVCVSLAISPYTYDYDMVSLALVAGLVLPRFMARARIAESIAALGLAWIATSNYLWIGLRQIWYGVPSVTAEMQLWTISPIALAALAWLVVTVLRRP